MASKSVVDLIINGIDNFSDKINSGIDATSKKLGNIGQSLTKTGGVMTAAFTTPIVAGFGVAVMAASDLSESISAVETVFGSAGDAIFDFGKTASTQVGLSEERFNALAIVTGSFLQNLGYDAEAAAQETINLTERASDMAAVFNTDVDQALMAIQSGLKGEFNPLEAFGVKMNAAGIEAKALAMGLADAEGELSDNAKAQAALAIVMEQTERITGTFQKEAESLGGSLRIVKAQLVDAAAAIGVQLLPYVTKAANFISKLIEKFSNLSPAVQKIIVIVGLVVAAIGPLLMVAGMIISAIGAILPVIGAVAGALSGLIVPILAVIAVIALIGAAIFLLYKAWKNNWGGIQEKTQAVIDYIKGVISNALDEIKAWWAEHGEAIMAAVSAMWETIKLVFQTVAGVIMTIVGGLLNLIMSWWDEHGALVMEIVNLLWNGIKNIINTVVTAIINVVGPFLEKIRAWWAEHGDAIVEKAQEMWNVVLSIFEWFGDQFGILLEVFKAAIEGDWTAVGEKLREIWDNAWEKIKLVVSNAWDWLKEVIPQLVETIIKFFKETDWLEVGKNIVVGIANGISGAVGFIVDAAKGAANAAFEAAKGFLGIDSPSKLFMDVGSNVSKGFAKGIENNLRLPELAIAKMSEFRPNVTTAGGGNTYNYNLTMPTSNQPQDVAMAFELLQAYGGN